jgi:glycosyltransferase involved in cell wall biosynthesis
MHVTIDGYVYQWQPTGGVSRIFTEILPRICDQEPSLAVTLLTEGERLAQSPPKHPQIVHRQIPSARSFLRPGRLWKNHLPKAQRLLRWWYTGSGKNSIWHSTYFTEPETWKGKRVVTVYDLVYHRFPNLFNQAYDENQRGQMHRCVKAADLVIAISEATRGEIQEVYRIDDSKIRVVPLACSQTFRRLNANEISFRPPTTRPFLLYVGDRNHYKNFNTLLKAYGLWPKRKEIDLVVAGPPQWSVQEIAQLNQLGIADQVKLLGLIPDEHLVALYNQAVALVHPSLYEGFGIPILEAMACGCLVVASRIASTIEVAEDYPIYFEALEAESLMAALDVALAAANNPVRRAKGLEHVRKFSWETTAQRTLAVYRELDAM